MSKEPKPVAIIMIEDDEGHARLIEKGSNYKATVHTHPIELIAMSHNKKFMGKDVLSNLLWSMIPETKAFCPLGLGIVHYQKRFTYLE